MSKMAVVGQKKPGIKVRVLYDYDYTNSQGVKISIKVGEICLLLKKSTEEWWSVLRDKEKKPIYVPANYVEELKAHAAAPVPAEKPKKKGPPPKPPTKPKLPKPSLAEDEALKELDEVINSALNLDMLVPDVTTFEEPVVPVTDESYKPDFNDNEPCYDTPIPVRGQDSDDEQMLGEDPPADYDMADASHGPRNDEATLQSTCSTGDSAIGSQDSLDKEVPEDEDVEDDMPDYANIRDLSAEAKMQDDQPDYANLSDIQAVIHKSSHTSIAESSSVVKELENDWQLRQDNKTKKYFRYHRVSKEVLWNDPRDMSSSPFGSLERRAGPRDSTVSQRDSTISVDYPQDLPSPVPSGWREENSDGEVFLVNDYTDDKWHRAVDKAGRTYYYKKGSGETVWELPEEGSVIQEEDESHDRGSALYDNSPTNTLTSMTSGLAKVTERKGYLYKTKCTENGKKIKKNWSQSYVELRGAGLYFYKDQKSAQQTTKNPDGKAEFSIGLRGCKISADTRDRSSKKHTLVLITSGGVEFLLQDSAAQGIADWCKAIAGNIASSMVSLSGSVHSLDELNHMEPVPHVADGNVPQRPGTPDDQLQQQNNSKFKDWINKWLKSRPSLESVKEKGYIKDGVFGTHLQTLYERTRVPVPVFVGCCLEAIEHRGLKVDGIFRVSGNLAQIQKLRFLVDKDEHYDLMNPEWDIHVITGGLKLFFRELSEPLFPFTFFEKFIEAVQIKDRPRKLKTFKELIKLLPLPNRETLRVLSAHLNRVTEFSPQNRMQAQNLAIVFGPTLMWPAIESPNLAISMVYQGQCIEFILQEHKLLF